MGTQNQSPSYLEARERARRFLLKTQDGAIATKLLKQHMPKGQNVLDDDKMVDWEEIVREHRGGTVLATSNQEAREAFRIAQNSSSIGAPPGAPSKLQMVAQIPLGYHLRRQFETQDPGYWNVPANLLREILEHQDQGWHRVPLDRIRGELSKYLGKSTSPILKPGE